MLGAVWVRSMVGKKGELEIENFLIVILMLWLTEHQSCKKEVAEQPGEHRTVKTPSGKEGVGWPGRR